ncbi:MAG: radical SAM family heme chaperone HemW [Coriobacteriales bacterium]|jgi:oxygen-independent coproporphyrinogen-3 oxidase|nr:radical SAM family heme chaperone HemW [Coriobacteriales bacterium]
MNVESMNAAQSEPYGALYLHIPFCASRCAYCDFTTEAVAPDDPRIDTYLDGLIREVRDVAREGLLSAVRSVYIGGGSPSFLGSRRLVQLVYTLALSIDLTGLEFTVEANPEQITDSLVRDLFALGVNRFSLGVQSFQDADLRALGRIHDAARARGAITAIRERCDNLSIDLICGIAGQTMASWLASLEAAETFDLPHISIYPLTVEEGTPFAHAAKQGRLVSLDEDTQALFMEQAAEHLRQQGYHRYEVASYAKPGSECRHNSAYWTGVSYLGLGRGAAGMRQSATGRERLMGGKVVETLTPAQAITEDLMLGMRMSEGIAREQLTRADIILPGAYEVFSELIDLGLVEADEKRYRPTARGWLLGNELYGRIWALAGVSGSRSQ